MTSRLRCLSFLQWIARKANEKCLSERIEARNLQVKETLEQKKLLPGSNSTNQNPKSTQTKNFKYRNHALDQVHKTQNMSKTPDKTTR